MNEWFSYEQGSFFVADSLGSGFFGDVEDEGGDEEDAEEGGCRGADGHWHVWGCLFHFSFYGGEMDLFLGWLRLEGCSAFF